MSLEVDEVPPVPFMRRVPEMIEADAEQRSDGGETGDVPAQLIVGLVRLCHHDHRVPAAEGADALLKRVVPWRALLQVRRNRVEVGGIERERNVGARATRLADELFQQIAGALGPLALKHRLQRIEPLLCLKGIGIVGGGKFRQRRHELSSFANARAGVRNLRKSGLKLTPPARPDQIGGLLRFIKPYFASYNQRLRAIRETGLRP